MARIFRNRRLAAALAYAKRGWRVFPLHGIRDGACTCGNRECSSPGKHPIAGLAPRGFKDATTDSAAIRTWWRRYPDANVGIATGEDSGIVVIDVDPRNGGTDSLAAVVRKHGEPETVTASTGGGGTHHYFKHPGRHIKCGSNVFGSGLDIKGDGGYVVAPPSSHVSGRRYWWSEGCGPSDCPLAAMPKWAREKKVKKARRGKRREAEDGADGPITEGERNNRLTSIAGWLRRQGLDKKAILAALRAINRSTCKPPLDGGELRTIAASAAKLPVGERKWGDPHFLAGLVLETRFRRDGQLTLRYYIGTWWIWEGDHYRHIHEHELRATVTRTVREGLDARGVERKVTRNLVSDVLQAMAGNCLLRDTLRLPSWIGSGKRPGAGDLLAMENGLLDLEAAVAGRSRRLSKQIPAWFSLTHWPYEYKPLAMCHKWNQFLKEVLPDKAARDLLQEFFGYCLTFDTSYHKFLVLVGEGANGKSVVTDVATRMIGPDNVTHVELERFGDRFALFPTVGKLANIVSEIGRHKDVAENILKAVVSGDMIRVEAKNHPPTQARPTVRLIFATNELPRFADQSRGIWRRLVILPFDVTIPVDRQDPKLARKICDRELSGIFNWALRGLRRLGKVGAATSGL